MKGLKRGMKIFVLLIAAVVVFGFVYLHFKEWFIRPAFSNNTKTKHLIVISLDALRSSDFEEFKDLPNFKKMIDSGSYARDVAGVYPSLTYPSHTSIVTGKYPVNHGIVNNERLQPGVEKPDWYWYRKDIKGETLYDLAEKANMRVGAFLWPVTAKANIDYNMPEIWPNKEGQNSIMLVLSSGSPFFLLDLQLRYGKMRNGTHQPELDEFTTASATHLIRSKKPNLVLIHFTELDKQRHLYGVMSTEAQDALKHHDKRLGQIVDATKEAGIYDESTFIVLGDHSVLDVQYKVNLNVEFIKRGLITVDKDGKVLDWKAVLSSCDGSAYVYLKNSKDQNTRNIVEEILNSYKGSAIETVYPKEDIIKMKANSDADYMIEGRNGYYFDNNLNGEVVFTINPGQIDYDKNIFAATHGYSYTKPGYGTFFMAAGVGIKKGVILPSIQMVDEGPTMATLLGLEMKDADGKVLEDILEK